MIATNRQFARHGEEATTIRLECWKRQLKRGSSPDGNRLVLELLGTQTLQDVHDVIVELSHDDLWDDSQLDTEQLPSGLFLDRRHVLYDWNCELRGTYYDLVK